MPIRSIFARSSLIFAPGIFAACSMQSSPALVQADARPPLASLALEGATLSPAFDASVHDYSVRCAAGTNRFTLTAAGSGVISMVQPASKALAPSTPTSVDVQEDSAVVVSVQATTGSTDEYWIRCLPHDFPQLEPHRSAPSNGNWYVLGDTIPKGGASGFAMVLDPNGTPVWYRRVGKGATYVQVVSHDVLAYSAALGTTFGTDPNGEFVFVDLEAGTERTLRTVGTPTDHHELLPLANGNFMLFSYPKTDGIDLSARGVDVTSIADCNIQEVTKDGALVWSWLMSEHVDAATESTDLAKATIGTDEVIDAFHCNSLDVADNGDVLVSVRHADALYRISRTTGQIVWKLGGTPNNKDGAQLIALQGDAEGGFFHQHDARFVASDTSISLFDDHLPQTGAARGIELQIDLATSTAKTTWQHAGPFGSAAMGSTRRMPDGSHIIGWGVMGTNSPTLAVTEVGAHEEPLFDLSFGGGDYVYRVVSVPNEDLDVNVLRRTAGH